MFSNIQSAPMHGRLSRRQALREESGIVAKELYTHGYQALLILACVVLFVSH